MTTEAFAFGELLYRPASRRVLGVLRDDWRTLSELTQALGVTKPSVHRALAPLIEAGFVEVETRTTSVGRERAYRAVPFDVAWSSRPGVTLHWVTPGQLPNTSRLLHQIPQGTARDDLEKVVGVIKTQKAAIRRAVKFVVVYGSVARGESTWKSDIDLLFVVDGDTQSVESSIRERLADPALDFHHAVHARVASTDDAGDETGDIIEAIREEGIIVHGDFDEEGGLWTRMKRYSATSS